MMEIAIRLAVFLGTFVLMMWIATISIWWGFAFMFIFAPVAYVCMMWGYKE